MTARTETIVPTSLQTRNMLSYYAAHFRQLASETDYQRGELRGECTDSGVVLPDDVLRILSEAADLLDIAARQIAPHEDPQA